MIEFRMPSLGADMEDGTLVEWRIEPGAKVERGQVVCVVDTQKGAIDVEIWDAGTVARLVAQPGERIPVGKTMALLAQPGEDWQAVARAEAVARADFQAAVPVASRSALPPRASPAARRRAAELGVDLEALAAGSAGAPITIEDVERAARELAQPVAPAAPATAPAEAAAAPLSPGGRAPQGAMREAIAAAMARSKREIPHYYLGAEIDVEAALGWLEAFNAGRPPAERVLFVALVLRAIAGALREVPDLNGRFENGRFTRAEAIHVGVVTALRGGGLVVPAVHDVDRLELPALMAALREVLARAKSGQLRSSDLADATITVSNMGDLGVETVYGVIYPPQVALVGLGRVAARPVVRGGVVVASRTMQVTLSGDHRVTDGLVGARFLSALRERLEKPGGS
jgi:pyruvate dehydrogenase E2 component (dihydrolipoamide acetyltransferase)